MTRLGLDVQDADKVFKAISKNPKLRCEGIYSHFATADEGELSYAHHQLNMFNSLVELGEKSGLSFKFIHCSNSGAILNLPESRFNLVRVGMLMYGTMPSDEVPNNVAVKPVMNYEGTIVNKRRVPKGTSISYGGIYVTDKETTIAVVQAGFADGFPRPWYTDGYVGYQGKDYKIAGRVCMDSFMVDFGDDTPEIGKNVLFFGLSKENHIPVETIAKNIDSTTYVLLTAIGGRTEYFYRD
jgi:alanine racemase